MNWLITIAVVVLVVAIAGYVLYRICLAAFCKSMDSNVSREELEIGLFNRHHLPQDTICKVFSRNQLERFYGAEFDDAGDVVRITNQQAVLKGFVTDRVKLSEFSALKCPRQALPVMMGSSLEL